MNPLMTFGIGELASSLYDKSGAKKWVDENVVDPALDFIMPPAQASTDTTGGQPPGTFGSNFTDLQALPTDSTEVLLPTIDASLDTSLDTSLDSGILLLDNMVDSEGGMSATESGSLNRSMFAEQAERFKKEMEEGDTSTALKTMSGVVNTKIDTAEDLTDEEKADAKKEFEAFGGSPDTWLLDFGLAMMSCDSPYFMQCLGNAGQLAQKSAKERELIKIKKESLKTDKEIDSIKLAIEKAKLEKEKKGGGTDLVSKINLGDLTQRGQENAAKFLEMGPESGFSSLYEAVIGEYKDKDKNLPLSDINMAELTPQGRRNVAKFIEMGPASGFSSLYDAAEYGLESGESLPLSDINMAELTPQGQKNVANFISLGSKSGFDSVFAAAAGNFTAEEGDKPTETTKLIRERQTACAQDSTSYECARLTSKVNVATAGVQTIDNPREASMKLEANRREDIGNLNNTSRTARQLMDLLGDDYDTFNKGDWEATQRTLDSLIQTATHSYRSVTDWATLGDDLIDELQSIGTSLAEGKPDENTWRNYRKLVDKTYNFVNSEVNGINRRYDEVAESQGLSEFWSPSTGYATISDFDGFKGLIQQDLGEGMTPDQIRSELRKRKVSPRDIERAFTELGIEG